MKRISDLSIQASLFAFQLRSMRHRTHHNTKTVVIIPVVGIVVVAIRTTHPPRIVVVRATTQHARDAASQPRQFTLAIRLYRFPHPASQQFTHLFNHLEDMLILSFTEILQSLAQAQV
jgi:hypothetical protein